MAGWDLSSLKEWFAGGRAASSSEVWGTPRSQDDVEATFTLEKQPTDPTDPPGASCDAAAAASLPLTISETPQNASRSEPAEPAHPPAASSDAAAAASVPLTPADTRQNASRSEPTEPTHPPSASSVAAAAARVLLTPAEASELASRSDTRVSRMRAHTFLKQAREELEASGREQRDLSDGQAFDWRGYVAGHPARDTIVGVGVCGFEVALLGVSEPNHTKTPGEHGFRCDFVAHRVDGTSARMHPSQKQEAKVVLGDRRLWALPGDGGLWAIPAAPASTRCPTGAFQGFSQSDTFTPRQFSVFVAEVLARENPVQRPYRREVTQRFPWWLYLVRTGRGRSVLAQGVQQVHLVEQQGLDFNVPLLPSQVELRVTASSDAAKAIEEALPASG